MKRLEPTYDSKCFELAEHFLADEPIPTEQERERTTKALAADIQQFIEEWLNTQ